MIAREGRTVPSTSPLQGLDDISLKRKRQNCETMQGRRHVTYVVKDNSSRYSARGVVDIDGVSIQVGIEGKVCGLDVGLVVELDR
jgi:hypothetical protein